MGKFNGGKFNGSHTTVTDSAQKLVKAIATTEAITKITPGMICHVDDGHGPIRMKIDDEPSGAQLTIRAGKFVQEFHVYFAEEHRKDTTKKLRALAPERHKNKRGKPSKKARPSGSNYDPDLWDGPED